MVPRLLGGIVVVIVGLALFASAALLAWDGGKAEGPYRRRESCRCVCK